MRLAAQLSYLGQAFSPILLVRGPEESSLELVGPQLDSWVSLQPEDTAVGNRLIAPPSSAKPTTIPVREHCLSSHKTPFTIAAKTRCNWPGTF